MKSIYRPWVLLAALLGSVTLAGVAEPLVGPYPQNNPPTSAKIELGRTLFYDPIFSEDGQVSCASCHQQAKAFTDGGAVSTGSFGRTGRRSAPSLVNVAYRTKLFWHGGATSLELQALGPLTDHNEHALNTDLILDRLRHHPTYPARFRAVFGREPDITGLLQAIASFERTLISYQAPFDRYQGGDARAFTPAQVRGMDLFYGKAECFHCHSGQNFSDNLPHNNGSEMFNEDIGLAQLTGQDEDVGKFITPTLRNIALSAPYMHAGQFKTLREVVQHYNDGGQANLNTDPLVRPLGLTEQEREDLVAFMEGLTDPTVATNAAFGPPKAR